MTEAATHFGWFWWTAIAVSFACGSTPFGVMIARSRGVDIRKEGSGNPGATNVGRVLGRRFGIACFLLDALKGATPVLLAGWLSGVIGRDAGEIAPAAAWGWMSVAVAAILGHCFSPFLGFRGGTGVAVDSELRLAAGTHPPISANTSSTSSWWNDPSHHSPLASSTSASMSCTWRCSDMDPLVFSGWAAASPSSLSLSVRSIV